MDVISTLRRRVFDRIGVRMAFVLAVALLPLAIVSIVRSNTIIRQSQQRSESALQGETLRALSMELGNIERLRGVALSLAAVMPSLLRSADTCSTDLARVVEGSSFTFAGFYTADGEVICSSAGAFSLVQPDGFEDRFTDPAPLIEINQSPQISRTSIIAASHPVYDPDGTFMGYVGVSMPHSAIGGRDQFRPQSMRGDFVPTVAFFTVDGAGSILTATGAGIDDAAALMPADLDVVDVMTRGTAFSARSQSGELRTYAVVPVLGGDLFAIGTWSESQVIEETLFYRFPALFPALMWLASLIAAYSAAELFVTRPVRRLHGAITRFTQDRRGVAADAFAIAPVELRDMAVSYNEMTDRILREEAELEDIVRQKDILLREVHHRVKNNLQLIASIMNMQMRKSRSDEARSLMRGLHDRVMSLATVHKGLYQTSGLADVQADELIADIVRQITHMGSLGSGEIAVEQHLDKLKLSPEQAVPLTLLVTEALTNALKYVGHAPGGTSELVLRLETGEGRQVRVVISNTLAPEKTRPPEGPTGLGSQLLTAFSQQLNATLDKRTEGDIYVVTVDFEAEPLNTRAETAGVF